MGISGKSDFEDLCCMNTPEEILNKYNIYVGNNGLVPLKMKTQKDLVVYYPYLITMSTCDNNGGFIYLSSESYIDIEEREWLQWKIDDIKKYYRKCKRLKIPFDVNEALKIACPNYEPDDFGVELVNRVKEFGNKATIENIHTSYHDKIREKWYKLMVENGWEEDKAYRWVFGWDRWLSNNKLEQYGDKSVQEVLDIN